MMPVLTRIEKKLKRERSAMIRQSSRPGASFGKALSAFRVILPTKAMLMKLQNLIVTHLRLNLCPTGRLVGFDLAKDEGARCELMRILNAWHFWSIMAGRIQ
jgi:hypothetical protein